MSYCWGHNGFSVSLHSHCSANTPLVSLKVVECKSSSRTWKEVSSIYLLLPSVDICLQNSTYSRFTPWFELLDLEMDIFSTQTHRYRAWIENVYLLI